MAPVSVRGRGFTLLELVLAAAVFAAMSSLLALLYALAFDVSGASVDRSRTLEVSRVCALAMDQWDARRVVRFGSGSGDAGGDAGGDGGVEGARVEGGSGFGSGDRSGDVSGNVSGGGAGGDAARGGGTVVGSGARFAPGVVTMVTAEPALFPSWPLVEAGWRIESADGGVSAGGDGVKRLVYVERRVLGFGAVPGGGGVTPDGVVRSGRKVLLDGVEGLRMERFGPARERPAPDAAREAAGEVSEDPRTPDEREHRWRLYDGVYEGDVWAVRFVGSVEGEAFSCVFAAERLR